MSQAVFHLGITEADLQGATLAIIPGDPARVQKIADEMENPVFLASHREYTLYRAELDGKPVVVCSTGIGGPSTSIAVEELAQLGVRTFLRVGTTGAIQPHVNVGDMIVTTGSVRLDGASLHFAPMEFPAVADFEIATAMKAAVSCYNNKGVVSCNFGADPTFAGLDAPSVIYYDSEKKGAFGFEVPSGFLAVGSAPERDDEIVINNVHFCNTSSIRLCYNKL